MIALAASLSDPLNYIDVGGSAAVLGEIVGAVNVEPTKSLHPVGIVVVVIIASWVWPIYFLLRAAIGALVGGLLKDIPFKLPAAAMLSVLIGALVTDARHRAHSAVNNCTDYATTEFKLLCALIFGYLVIAVCLRRFNVRERLYAGLHRHRWPLAIRSLDGVAAVGLVAITAPWFLEGVRELLQLPESPVITQALRASSWLLSPVTGSVGYTYGHLLGGGKSFIESSVETLQTKVAAFSDAPACPPNAYTGGGWLLLATLFSVCLMPAAVAASLPWLSSRRKWDSVWKFGVPDIQEMATFDGSRKPDPPIGLFALGWMVFGAWLLLDFVIFVVRIATGV